MDRLACLTVVALLLIAMSLSAMGPPYGQAPLTYGAYGPCFFADDQTRLELYARGTCRCRNGACVVVECSGEVGASVEATKGDLRLRLEAQARARDGMLVGEVQFTLRRK